MNDCAADVPPVENLWKYTAMGFDLVTFSGGKGIRGPQSAGMLLGRKDLVAAARLNAPPNASIGRGLKVNKEEMLGMLVALELFLKKDFEKERKEFDARAEEIRKAAAAVPGVKVEVWVPEVANHVPHIRVSLPAEKKAADIVKAMRDGEPSIAIRNEGEQLVMSTWMMRAGEDKVVAKRLRQVLEGKA
jgi:seryl-tRNA(Sec) selenium transferase